jgi:hypothetical protein
LNYWIGNASFQSRDKERPTSKYEMNNFNL